MELWDIYDAYRKKTNRTHQRGLSMNDGDYHLVVHVWIRNDEGKYLIQKRQPWKEGWPDKWECAAAGSATVGDDSKAAAIRETKEEIGVNLDIENGEVLFSIKFGTGFDDVWLVHQNVEESELELQFDEVAEVKWATEEEIMQMVANNEFIPFPWLREFFEIANSPIKLEIASDKDVDELLAMQKEVFTPLYEKYEDHETTPVNQTLEGFLKRFMMGDYYKIMYDGRLAGGVLVYEKEPGQMRFHIINIRKLYQNKGIAQEVMKRLEWLYPQAEYWELETIATEEKNCYLYEKMGYVRTGDLTQINDRLSLVSYVKEENIHRLKKLS